MTDVAGGAPDGRAALRFSLSASGDQ